MGHVNERTLSVLRWTVVAGVCGTGLVGVLVDQEPLDSVKPCADVRAITAQAGLLPNEALVEIDQIEANLDRRRAAHERSLGQLDASVATTEDDQQRWLAGAIEDERAILEEITEAEAGLEDARDCLEGGGDGQ